ncbi:MAG: leucine-rich repeat protein [Treponematales bacterium]
MSVTIGNSVGSIGELAFYGCASLTSVTIPTGVTHIEYYAFTDCSGLTRVAFARSAAVVADANAFPSGASLLTVGGAAAESAPMAAGTYMRPHGGSTWTKMRP